MSRAIFLRFPTIVVTWPIFSSISPSRASFVILTDAMRDKRKEEIKSNYIKDIQLRTVKYQLILVHRDDYILQYNTISYIYHIDLGSKVSIL
jgi:hypothetical protein